MSDECKYYYYDHGYSCALKREKEGNSSVDSDIVHKYCWGYHYEDCPRYKEGNSSGGCFLTSACVEARGLSADCYELLTLRKFRDEYMKKQECGKCEIAHYYAVAPKIVERIKLTDNAASIFDEMYTDLVSPCVRLIEQLKSEDAHKLYRNYVQTLEKMYLCEGEA